MAFCEPSHQFGIKHQKIISVPESKAFGGARTAGAEKGVLFGSCLYFVRGSAIGLSIIQVLSAKAPGDWVSTDCFVSLDSRI